MHRRQFLTTATAGATILAFPAVLRGQSKDPIRIGFPLPLTGTFAAIAADMHRGAQLAMEELNAKGGIMGRKLEVLFRDDELKPAVGAQRTKELIENQKVDFVVGGLAALAIRLTSRGPVLFRQERVGKGGEPFEVVKFRTMVHLDEPNPLIPDPDRITRVGAFLRRFSLDELPQLLNVARGEMSIVGPRPTLAYQVERYSDRERQRLRVRPGLTGLAQVNGRNAIAWSERIEHGPG